MPIYEYHCSDCGNDFEKLVRFSDPTANSPACPGCQSEQTQKRLSMIAAFSGSQTQGAASAGCGSSGPFR